MTEKVTIERAVDLPRAIVEDAFTDPVLVQGWYHPTELPDPGTVELDDIVGGTRGSSTSVRITVPVGARAAVVAAWEHRLDLLENLLRGHPVDWNDEHGPAHGVPDRAAR